MSKRDYYEVLGVDRSVDASELKRAYRRLAMEHHPDRNPGDHKAEERFKELAEAYQVLSDPEKRGLYDRFGHNGPQQSGFSGFSGIEDILSTFADFFGGGGFGGGRRGPRVEPGDDVQASISVTLLESAKGGAREITVDRNVQCSACGGSGCKAGTQPQQCGTCGGRGQVMHNQGIFMVQTTCPHCRGRGRSVQAKDRCTTCKGNGVEGRRDTLTINVPPGIDDGQTLRVVGKGEASRSGGPPGNLYVTFHVQPDERFEREGEHLFTQVTLSYAQAALGTKIKVPTVDGELDLEVEPGTQPGDVVLMRGKGLPNVHGRGVGDLAVRFQVSVPKKLSSEQRELVEKLAAIDGDCATCSQPKEEDERWSFFRRKKKKK